jgi:hypothetical protein
MLPLKTRKGNIKTNLKEIIYRDMGILDQYRICFVDVGYGSRIA